MTAPLPKPQTPRVPVWVTEKELRVLAKYFEGFHGSLADAIHAALIEARAAKSEHNRALRAYRASRREEGS
jgi:hypothetical protein